MKTGFMFLTAFILVLHVTLFAQEWQEYTLEGSGMYVRLTEDAGLSPAEQLLKTIGWTYDKQEDGDIHLTLQFEDERTQLVRLVPVVSSFTGLQTYDIWSVVSNDPMAVPDSMYRKMLIRNGDTDIGRFQIFPGDSADLIVYSAVFEGEMNPEILKDIINEVAAMADIFEEQITRKDDY
jgi:hypothetical protein